MKQPKIAVIGGGIAGTTAALYLGGIGLDVTLFEKNDTLISGPPFCHLHAGGNLYREISDEQCLTLLEQSIDLVRFYPQAVDYRPTVIAVPLEDSGSPEALFPRLEKLRDAYAALIAKDPHNKVLGESAEYFKLYGREDIEKLAQMPIPAKPRSFEDWMIPVAKHIELDKVKFPLVMVQEYGLNLFRMAASVTLALRQITSCRVFTGCEVTGISQDSKGWSVQYTKEDRADEATFDYLINAAGYLTGSIDDMLGFKRERMVEFKAAYVSKWDKSEEMWPEVVFHGERGTPRGMGQFTPYPNGYFQLHGMTESITLFKDGLVKNAPFSAQPQLGQKYINKIDRHWKFSDVADRSHAAIAHLAQYIPEFASGKVASKPLYGAQQIPGNDPTLRAADVSFEGARYARCEIVKASSVLTMMDEIIERLIGLGYVDKTVYGKRDFTALSSLDEETVTALAEALCKQRGYPLSLAYRNVAG